MSGAAEVTKSERSRVHNDAVVSGNRLIHLPRKLKFVSIILSLEKNRCPKPGHFSLLGYDSQLFAIVLCRRLKRIPDIRKKSRVVLPKAADAPMFSAKYKQGG